MINVSIVIYKHKLSEVAPLIYLLRNSPQTSHIYLIDNSPTENREFAQLAADYIYTGKNLGYGAAHNIAIRQSIKQNRKYHLVINPDISFDPLILEIIAQFMNNNSKIGLLMPKVYYPNGEIQYLCKLVPGPFDLIIRRFLPSNWTKRQTEKFELRKSGYNQLLDVPYLSGCFMFLKTDVLKETGLFDERFFMYPEDIDLSRRIHSKYRTVYYPEVSVIHYHAKSSYENNKMLTVHIVNMIKYFNKWGWFFDWERKKINTKTLKQLT